MLEQWKDIPGLGGKYQASNFGNIRNQRSGRVLKPRDNLRGYLRVNIFGKQHRVSRLVAFSFVPNSEGLPEVNHLDGNKTNNCPNNLEWCSRGDNIRHAFRTGLNKPLRGTSNGRHKLTEQQVIEVFELAKSKAFKHREIARRFNIDRSTVGYILNGKLWRHIGRAA